MIKLFRVIFFIPSMYLGAFLSVIVTAIWNLPLTFLEWLMERTGDWNLWGLIFGSTKTTSFEILYVLSSGIFLSSIGLFFALSVFPYKKHRNKIIYFLLALLLIGYSSQVQLDTYNNIYLYSAKIIGIIIGFGIILKLVMTQKTRIIFDYFDKKVKDKEGGKIEENNGEQ